MTKWRSTTLLITGMVLMSCGSEDPTDVSQLPVSALTLSDTVVTFVRNGATFRLTATATDEFGQRVDAAVSWASSSPQVASVADGLLTSVGEGEATISATVGTFQRTARVVVLPDGESAFAYVTSFESGHMVVIDVRTNTISDTVIVDAPGNLAITPNRALAYVTVGGNEGGLWVVDLRTHRVLHRFRMTIPADIAITPDGFQAYLTHPQSPIGLMSLMLLDNHSVFNVGVRVRPSEIVLTPDALIAYVTTANDSTTPPPQVATIDLTTLIVADSIPVGAGPRSLSISPNGRFVYVTNTDSDDVSVIDLGTERVVATVPVGAQPVAVAFTPDAASAYVASSDYLSVIDVATHTVTSTIPVGAAPVSIAFTQDGAFAYVASHDAGEVAVIDVATSTVVATIPIDDPGPIAIR